MKIALLVLVLIFSSSFLKADYQFNNLAISIANINDKSLSESLEGQAMSANLSGEISESLVLSGGLSITAYDEKTIDDIYVDFAFTSLQINIAKVFTFKNDNKVFAYMGLARVDAEAAIDSLVVNDSDTGLSYGAGLIAPINQQIDLQLNLDLDTLFNETNQSISLGLSFDLDDIAAIQTSFTHQDEVDAITLAIRFNYE